VVRTARPYALAVALLATIFTATVIWASTPPSPANATPTNILGTDGRYTLLFLGSDKRCAKKVGKTMIMTERCDTGTVNATEWTWSAANDKAAGVLRQMAGKTHQGLGEGLAFLHCGGGGVEAGFDEALGLNRPPIPPLLIAGEKIDSLGLDA
jgi:hypothetical protein